MVADCTLLRLSDAEASLEFINPAAQLGLQVLKLVFGSLGWVGPLVQVMMI